MAHCFHFKIPKDQMQMIILFQWSNKLQCSLLLVTQVMTPVIFTVSQKSQGN